MKLSGYYSSGEFARMAHVSLRTIRYYDQKNLLKPSYTTSSGSRFYTEEDFGRLQQILLFKYLGFSLNDIREMMIAETDSSILQNALSLQKKLVEDRMEQMQLVVNSIDSAMEAMNEKRHIDWSHMLELIHLTAIENSLKNQYRNASNISARIRLHQDYSVNKQGWFPWIYEKSDIRSGMKILELGCGNGSLWLPHIHKESDSFAASPNRIPLLPDDISIILSDISEGMIRDVRRSFGTEDKRFSFVSFDCHQIPFEPESFDLVIANHVLFYCRNLDLVCQEVRRVLKPSGKFLCSTYSSRHMKEITELVQEFDSRIVLSGEKLYERFGLDNGKALLEPHFSAVEKHIYPDEIMIQEAEPLIAYILSCHGNQNQILLDRYGDFKGFVEKKTKHGLHITKDAGIFLCQK